VPTSRSKQLIASSIFGGGEEKKKEAKKKKKDREGQLKKHQRGNKATAERERKVKK